MKNIILCSDGTGNQDIKGRGTNVFKLFEAIDIHSHKSDESKVNQIAFYDDGVGTSNLIFLKLIGGAFGWGLKRNVLELYASLVRVYTPGDRIYLFGFSRGAYTVRTLSGLIKCCGVIDAALVSNSEELNKRVNYCWKLFKKNFSRWKTISNKNNPNGNGDKLKELSTYGASEDSKKIHFIGVWDTVSAIVPLPGVSNLINFIKPFRFPDFMPGEHVCHARHALAIDDERKPFHPDLWDEKRKSSDQQIKQVWFAGSHSNVGGGYSKQGMSLVALDWMMREAESNGLDFIQESRSFVENQRNVNDKLYDPRAGLGLYYRWKPRNIADLCLKNGISKPLIHESVFERILSSTEGYRPGNIPYIFEIEPTEEKNRSETNTRFREMISQFKLVYEKKISEEKISEEKMNQKSMLDGHRRLVLLGRLSYALFVLSSALLLGYAGWTLVLVKNGLSNWNLMTYLALIAAVGLASWLLAAKVDREMCRAYDSFWSSVTKIVKSYMSPAYDNTKSSNSDQTSN